MQLRRCAVLPALFFGLVFMAFPQADTGVITGTVVDASGAAVPNANVSIVQTETNFHFTTVANGEGIYRVQSLQPGPYTVTFEAQGFKRLVQGNVTLRVGDVLPVNATMQVGAVTESVEVNAQSTLLETETSVTGTVTEGAQLYKLPMYQRYITNTLSIVPGVSNQTTGRTRIMTHRQYFNLNTSAQAQPSNPNGVPGFFMMPDGNGGGPVVIPRVYNGRNKTFWYSGYSKLIEKKTQAYTSVTPTPAELQGDFTFGGAGQPLFDPATTRQNGDGT